MPTSTHIRSATLARTMKTVGAKCFVAAAADQPHRVLGFYMLNPASLDDARTPTVASKAFGRYDMPVFRLWRLAVGLSVQGRGIGGALLLRAAARCMRVAQEVGGVALSIDAEGARAADRCAELGAVRLFDAPWTLIIPSATVADVLNPRGRS